MQKYPHTFRYADILFRCFLFFYLARPFEREFCDDDGDDLVDDRRRDDSPDIKAATDASVSESVLTAMPVNTRDTPEWGNNSVI